MKKYKIIIVTIIILITILIIVSLFLNRKIPEDKYEKSINSNELLGSWFSVSEQVGFDKPMPIDYYNITFNNDYTYTAATFGLEENGKYTFENNEISFYENEEKIQTTGKIEDNKLSLIIPEFPKTIVYKR